MHLTAEQETIGRRNFLKVLAGTPALAALGTVACGPERAMHSAKACMLANQAIEKKTLLKV